MEDGGAIGPGDSRLVYGYYSNPLYTLMRSGIAISGGLHNASDQPLGMECAARESDYSSFIIASRCR